MPRLSFPEAVRALEGTDKFFVNDIGVETELGRNSTLTKSRRLNLVAI